MIISISIDTTQELTVEDKALLRAIAYLDTEDTTPAEAPKAAAKKTTPAKKAAASVKATEPETAVDEEARAAAVTRASELLSDGQRDRVMKALKAAGAPKVSEISADALPGFIEALSDDAA